MFGGGGGVLDAALEALGGEAAALLQVQDIRKRYGGVQALKGVAFALRRGEVHVLLGENGAGKSTLMGVLSGAVVPDAGTILLDGAPVRFASPREAHLAGIAMIPQELDLVPGLDIAANLFLGSEITHGGVLAHAAMRRQAQALLARAGVRLDAGLLVGRLRMGERQLVAIAKHAGEIVGLAGRMGVGRTELLSALHGFGASGRWRGTVEMQGRPAALGTIAAARRAGIAYVTDDRRGTGLVLQHSVAQNAVMSTLRRVTPWGLVSRARERRAVAAALEHYDIRPRLPAAKVVNLSGGNQQKVVFAKELMRGPRLLLLDEPTRGVDVGAKAELYRRMRALAGTGLGVLVASSELPELIGLCDRIVVMQAGRTVHAFAGGPAEADVRRASDGDGEREAA